MSINIGPATSDDLRPRITVIGVGGAGGNAIANMMDAQIEGVDSMEGLITNQNASNPSFVIEAVYSVYNANPYKIKIDSLDTTVTIQTTASTP